QQQLVRAGPFSLDAEAAQQSERGFDVAQMRYVAKSDGLAGQQRRHQDRQRGVLAAADGNGAAQWCAAVDNHLVHWLLRELRSNYALDTREVPQHINVAETGAAEKSRDLESLPGADFHHRGTVGSEVRTALARDTAIHVEPVRAEDQRDARLVQ